MFLALRNNGFLPLITLLFCGAMLFGCKKSDAESETSSTQSSLISQECNGEVILEMGNVKLKVPRNNAYVNSAEFKDIRLNKQSDDYDCTANAISNVSTYKTGEITIGYRPDKAVKTTYSSYQKFFEDHNAVLDEQLEVDGVKHIKILSGESEDMQHPDNRALAEYYILSKEIAPTSTGEPVLYSCEIFPDSGFHAGVWCKTSYYHPSGLFIDFRFPRHQAGVEYILDRNKENRNWINKAIIEDGNG